MVDIWGSPFKERFSSSTSECESIVTLQNEDLGFNITKEN